MILVGGCVTFAMWLLAAGVAAETAADPPTPSLEAVLARLANRAALYESLLYRMECLEDISLHVHRRADSRGKEALAPRAAMNVRDWVLVERTETGQPRELRFKVGSGGSVELDRKGQPIEVRLPSEFGPLAKAFPHAQVAWFTKEKQKGLRFRLLRAGSEDAPAYLIECPEPGLVAVEFLDPVRPRRIRTLGYDARCEARASGQMCLDPDTGEIRALEFYGTAADGFDCKWELAFPFASIELEVEERGTGLHFPSRVETLVPRGRDTAVFVQRFVDCGFADVHATETSLSFTPPPKP